MSEYQGFGMPRDDFEKAAAANPAAAAFLDDKNVHAVLKELYSEILPARDLGRFEALVKSGAFDNAVRCGEHPLGGMLSQLAGKLGREELLVWLKPVLARKKIPLEDLQVDLYLHQSEPRYRSDLDHYPAGLKLYTVNLTSWLVQYRQAPLEEIAGVHVRLLSLDYNSGDTTQPAAHHLIQKGIIDQARLEKVAAAAGTNDFLHYPNAAGENIFYVLATRYALANHLPSLQSMSWMLAREPGLISSTDRFGWTVLDRYVANALPNGGAQLPESGLLRLLVSSGAAFRWQMAPGIPLANISGGPGSLGAHCKSPINKR